MENLFKFDYSIVRKRSAKSDKPDWQYWMNESIEKRFAAVEFIRESYYGDDYATQGIQRVYRITRKK